MSFAGEVTGENSFRNPPARHRSVPFWAWNAKLDPTEISRQIHAMKEQGMGGFFMHSRDGLETPYLGPEWMEAVRTAVATAAEEGLSAWLYDEDRWPSGSAGGKVPAQGDAFRAKGLTIEVSDRPFVADPTVTALFRVQTQDLKLITAERLDPRSTHDNPSGSEFLIFRIEVSAPDEWFNGETPPDNLNPATVDAFIETNYEPYREAIGDAFGRTVPGIFTDEPSVHDRHSRYPAGRGWVPWTYQFAHFFRSRRGYDPLDLMPQVFFDGPQMSRIRHDYWRTVTELFSESYTKRLADWCGRNRLLFTGHFLWENQLGTATRTGGAIMPHYRFQDLPGIDLLCEQLDETITVKQCTSVANQYGRPQVLSETYGCTGWEFTFEGQKWLGDWQFVLGVNVRCQHLALYSLRGCRKRDYPPSFGPNTSWWRHNHLVEDYFARLSVLLSEGVPVRDLLILHPSSTAWARLASNPRGFADRGQDRNLPEVNAYGAEFNRLLETILGSHRDFDLGDETILAEVGGVNGASLTVNQAAYRAVLIPPIDTLLGSTLNLLLRFLDAGGHVVELIPLASLIEGVTSSEIARLHRHAHTHLATDLGEALQWIEQLLPRTVSLTGPNAAEDTALLCQHRRSDDGSSLLFAVNTDRTASRTVRIEWAEPVLVTELFPLDGQSRAVEAHRAFGKTSFLVEFGPAGSRAYRLTPVSDEEANNTASAFPAFPSPPNYLLNPPIVHGFGPMARFHRTDPNALVLDVCSYRLFDGAWSDPLPVWQAQRAIRSTLGMKQVFGNGLTQRYLWADHPHAADGAPAAFRFTFDVRDVPQSDVFFVWERPREFQMSLNGALVDTEPTGCFLDPSFEKIRLPELRCGQNELVVECDYRNSMEIEDGFLLGDFAVDENRTLIREPERLRFGDWCLQGYPHYCGSLVYEFELEQPGGPTFLRLGEHAAVTVEIRVNGKVAGHIPWRDADGLELTDSWHEGVNRLEIEVVGSPRNLLGPFHLARGTVAFHEWTAFRTEGAEYTPDYVLKPYGLFSQVILSSQ